MITPPNGETVMLSVRVVVLVLGRVFGHDRVAKALRQRQQAVRVRNQRPVADRPAVCRRLRHRVPEEALEIARQRDTQRRSGSVEHRPPGDALNVLLEIIHRCSIGPGARWLVTES
jgi:hypothetical protein